jgi:hypothetical protein
MMSQLATAAMVPSIETYAREHPSAASSSAPVKAAVPLRDAGRRRGYGRAHIVASAEETAALIAVDAVEMRVPAKGWWTTGRCEDSAGSG